MSLSRRSFVVLSSCCLGVEARASRSIPIGLELYSVREALKQDPQGRCALSPRWAIECIEFYAPYFEWSETETKQMRKLLDDLGSTASPPY